MRDAVREDRLQYEGWPVVGACGMGAFFATVPLSTFGVFLQPLGDTFSFLVERSGLVGVWHADAGGRGVGPRRSCWGARSSQAIKAVSLPLTVLP
jgi:hypothetical protein